MSRFGFKIFAALLFMGVVSLVGTVIISRDALEYSTGLQQDALEAIEGVSIIHRAWSDSERGRVRLLTERLATSPALAALGACRAPEAHDCAAREAAARGELDELFRTHDVLQLARLQAPGWEAPLVFASPDRQPPDALNEHVTVIDLAAGARLAQGTLAARGAQAPTLEVTFGLPLAHFELFDELGDRRERLRTMVGEGDAQGPAVDAGSGFLVGYLAMLGLVVVCTIGLALLITVPVNRRIARLAAATRKVAADDLTVQLPVEGRDELAQLMTQFNTMVTELRETRDRLTYLERIGAWQEVARRLAHEIKNPLTPLQLAIQELDRKFDDYLERPPRYRALVSEVVEIVTEEVQTLQKLVKEFSEFARLPALDLKPMRLGVFIAHTLRTNLQITQAAEVDNRGGPGDCWVRIDTTLMRRVLVNLLDNAIEAIRPTGRDPELALWYERVEARGLVRLVIEDNGPGIKPEHLERLFEPYFTTKDTGTGLGLALVRKIVIDHGGDVHLSNRVDEASAETLGARVQLELPLMPPVVVDEAHSDAEQEASLDADMVHERSSGVHPPERRAT